MFLMRGKGTFSLGNRCLYFDMSGPIALKTRQT